MKIVWMWEKERHYSFHKGLQLRCKSESFSLAEWGPVTAFPLKKSGLLMMLRTWLTGKMKVLYRAWNSSLNARGVLSLGRASMEPLYGVQGRGGQSLRNFLSLGQGKQFSLLRTWVAMSSSMSKILSPDGKEKLAAIYYPSPATCKSPSPYSQA